MNDINRGTRKQKITYTASTKGIERAETALRNTEDGSKKKFAERIHISRSTVTNFFSGKPIQLESFKPICDALGLSDWREIAGIKQVEKLQEQEMDNPMSTYLNEGMEAVQTIIPKTTVRDDPDNADKEAFIILKGNLSPDLKKESFEAFLREYSGNSLKITALEKGSIKLSIKGSPEDIKQIVSLIESKKITQLNGFPVEKIEILDKNSAEKEIIKSNNKWSLVEEIVSNPVKCRDLSDADLSGADLSGADLSDADLSGADLRSANLVNSNLRNADLRNTILWGANLENSNLENADLENTYIVNANLSNANLEGANLEGAKLGLAYLDWNEVQQINPIYIPLFAWQKILDKFLQILGIGCSDLQPARFKEAKYNDKTSFPKCKGNYRFNPVSAGMEKVSHRVE
jgi:transcriptional regulator with XRE-family HTH domain